MHQKLKINKYLKLKLQLLLLLICTLITVNCNSLFKTEDIYKELKVIKKEIDSKDRNYIIFEKVPSSHSFYVEIYIIIESDVDLQIIQLSKHGKKTFKSKANFNEICLHIYSLVKDQKIENIEDLSGYYELEMKSNEKKFNFRLDTSYQNVNKNKKFMESFNYLQKLLHTQGILIE